MMKVDLLLDVEALHSEQGGKLFGEDLQCCCFVSAIDWSNVQLFRRRIIQILGAVLEREVKMIRFEILYRLRVINTTSIVTYDR